MAGNTSMTRTNRAPMPDPTDFEQLLRREMTIAPSGEFLARVRTRIDEEAFSPRWSWRWLVPLSGAAACTALVVMAMLNGDPATLPSPPAAPSLATVQPIPRHEAPMMQPTRSPVRATPAIVPALDRAAIVSRPEEPVVIVDERQRAALAAFIHVIRDGRVTGHSFAQTTPVSLDPIRDRVKAVEAGPLTVSAILIDGVLQEEHR